jgi:hypothetical protein
LTGSMAAIRLPNATVGIFASITRGYENIDPVFG